MALGLAGLSFVVETGFPVAIVSDGSPLGPFFGVAAETNLWTWYNVAILLLAATAHAAVALVGYASRTLSPWPWLATAAVLAALSLDDLASLHEKLHLFGTALGGGSGPLFYAWVIPGAGLGAMVALAVFMLVLRVQGRPRLYLWSGITLFLGAALGIEALSGAVFAQQGHSALYRIVYHFEEILEAFGSILLLCAALAALRVRTRPDGIVISGVP